MIYISERFKSRANREYKIKYKSLCTRSSMEDNKAGLTCREQQEHNMWVRSDNKRQRQALEREKVLQRIMHFISTDLLVSYFYWAAAVIPSFHFLCIVARWPSYEFFLHIISMEVFQKTSKTWTNFTSTRPTQMHDLLQWWWMWNVVELPHNFYDAVLMILCGWWASLREILCCKLN